MAKKKVAKKKVKKENKSEEKIRKKEKSKREIKTEEVCNTFKISDGKKEKTEVHCGTIEKKYASKEEIKSFSKTLGIVLAFLVFLFILFFSVYYLSVFSKIVTFKGVEYHKLQVGDVLFYHAQIPYLRDLEGTTKYNVYLRSNPKEISKKIPLDGEDIRWKQLVVTNYSTGGLVCDGYTIIAQANFHQILSDGVGLTMVRNDTLYCDDENRYMYLLVEAGDETKIEKIGESCYRLEFTNCEILQVTERFILEAVSKYYEKVK